MEELRNHGKKWFYWFLLGLALILIYKALDNFTYVTGAIGQFLNLLAPFLVGILIAYILYIPCQKIENTYIKSKSRFIKKKARTLSIITVYFIVILILIILINVILPVVWESVVDLINNAQNYYTIAIDRYNNLPENSVLKSDVINELVTNVQTINLKQYFQFDRVMEYLGKVIGAVTGIFNILVAVTVSIYVLSERTKIIRFLKRLTAATFKEATYKNIDKYYNHSNKIFFDFISSQFVDAIVVGILVTITMSIMGVKYAPLLGFFIGLFNMIPYIGAIIAVAISAIITLITGGLSQTIWMLIVVIILQQIDANIINPKIVGQSLKISPLLVLFAVTIGGAYFGMLGMFLAVPVAAIIKIIAEDYVSYKLTKKKEKV